ncbi:MAG TPA: fumarylacetoacetate hydrolase family protein [Alphaproteobacteria bacterium]|nr:fumarylacetoacetate hydrolase family protein [Alphaproteobacteria bacterium]
MIDFRLLNFAGAKGKAIPGIKVGEDVIDLTIAAPIYERRAKKKLGFSVDSTLSILQSWSKAKTALAKLATEHTKLGAKSPYAKATKPLKRVKLLAPILYPSTVFCIAANYADHHAEMGSSTMPDKSIMPPVFFQKTPAQTVVGHGAEIPLPHTSTQIDWEAELAIVIGKPCFNVPKEKAFDYIAGYMVLNDMSIRGPSRADAVTPVQKQFRADRFRRKNFDGSCPTGPWLTPKDLVKNPYDLKIQLWVNGDLKQNGNSGAMHYNIEEQIAYLSEHLTLQPGDVITTGTPAGVGKGKGTYLKAGDKITTTVGNLGTLETSFVPSKKPTKA